MTTYIAAAFLLLLVILVSLVPAALPTAINVAASLFLALKIAKRRILFVPVLIAVSALLSFNVRIPSMITEGGTPGKLPQSHIAKKTLIGPDDKLRLDADSDVISYRQTNEVLRWGLQNDWRLRLGSVSIISEYPNHILREQGVAATPGTEGNAVLRIRNTLRNDGIVEISAQIINNGEIAATYRHEARRSYPFEEIDQRGMPRDNWVSHLLYLTQFTPWNIPRDLFPKGYSPFSEFLKNAVGQYALSASGTVAQPVLEQMNDPAKLIEGTARLVFEDTLSKLSVPPLKWHCNGEDAGHEFTVTPLVGIAWKDKEIPGLKMPIAPVDGYSPSPVTSVCSGNHFWISAYQHNLKRLYVWHYVVDFRGRSLRLQEWVKADLPKNALARVEKWQRRGLHLNKVGKTSYELFFVHYDEDSFGMPTAKEGIEIEIKLPVKEAKQSKRPRPETK